MICNYFLITLMVVFVLDMTDFYDNMSSALRSFLTKGRMKSPVYVKPWCCSLCMSHHINFLVMLCTGHFSLLHWFLILLFAVLTPLWRNIIQFCMSFAEKVLEEMRIYFHIN